MFYIIGVHHGVQFDKQYSSTPEFISYLKKVIKKYAIEIIAEESSKDVLKEWKIEKTSVQEVSVNHDLQYIACDPSIDERKTLGIRSDEEIKQEKGLPKFLNHEQLAILDEEKIKDFPQRENYWLDKIKKYSARHVIFICGLDHLNSSSRSNGFEKLLITNKLSYKLLMKF